MAVVVALSATGLLVRIAWARLRWGYTLFEVPFDAALVVAAALSWWYLLRADRAESRRSMGVTLRAAAWVGGLGFAAGFFGPILLTPESNQGPLLGIFFTGPAGFVLGALGGIVVALVRERQRRSEA